MKSIRITVFVMSLSFTLVMSINAILMIFNFTTIITGLDILAVLSTCFAIATAITIGNKYLSFFKEHSLLSSYCVVMVLACGSNYIFYQHFYWVNLLIEIVLTTLVFVAVWLGVYGISLSDADKINKKLSKSNER